MFASPGSYTPGDESFVPPRGLTFLFLPSGTILLGVQGKLLDHRGLSAYPRGCKLIKSLQYLGECIGYFEKAPDLAQTQANIITGEQRMSLLLSCSRTTLTPCPCMCSLTAMCS